jgi:hypothetical protein
MIVVTREASYANLGPMVADLQVVQRQRIAENEYPDAATGP